MTNPLLTAPAVRGSADVFHDALAVYNQRERRTVEIIQGADSWDEVMRALDALADAAMQVVCAADELADAAMRMRCADEARAQLANR